MARLISSHLGLALAFCSLTAVAISSEFGGNCMHYPRRKVLAYTNWPFRMDCDHLKKIWEEDSRSSPGDIYECEIGNGTEYSEEGIFEIESMDGTTSYAANLIVNNATCLTSEIEIQLRQFPQEQCLDYLEGAYADELVAVTEGWMERSLNIRCIPPAGMPEIIPKGADRTRFVTRWNLDCDRYDEPGDKGAYRSNGHHTSDPDGYPDVLNLHSIDFYDTGNFTCEVTYNGRLMRVMNTAVCMKQNPVFKEPTITCTEDETEGKGETAELNCKGQVVIGQMLPGDIVVEWRKRDSEVLCRNEVYNKTEVGLTDLRHTCSAKGDNSSIICAKSPDMPVQAGRRIVEMNFEISDLTHKDFGDYEVVLKYKNSEAKKYIRLKEDMTPFYERLVIILASVLASIIFLVFLFLAYKYFEIYFQIWYKRSWLWKHDKDDKTYVAYLSYYYNVEMKEDNLKSTSKIVYAIQSQLESMNYSYYDEYREIDFSVKVEKITNLVENCHRMVIVLSPEYLNDKWMRFHAELGFHGLLESRMGLVFILLPKVRKMLAEKARKDKVWEQVLIAVKANRVVNWNEKMSEDRFRRHIEYAMPKLRREKGQESDSLCSEAGVSPDLMRSLSQNTEHTIVPSSPDSDSHQQGAMVKLDMDLCDNVV